jgi:translation initiation factor 2B subunit (eIF-2B alpha/beta/delta family)
MKSLVESLESIEQDSVSGSAALVENLIDLLISFEASLTNNEKTEVIARIDLLTVRKPFFAVIDHFSNALKDTKNQWMPFLIEYKQYYNSINRLIYNQLSSRIQSNATFLLHSHSHTIVSVFELVAPVFNECRILQTHSEPEGHIQAKKLEGLGFNVEMISDTVPDATLNETDYFITGADLVLPSWIINKTGTKWIAEKMFQFNKPYFVLTDIRKMKESFHGVLPPLFEMVPRSLVTHVMTGS